MKFYSLINTKNDFGRFFLHKTYNPEVKKCMTCMISYDPSIYFFIPPFKGYFQPSSRILGDFSYGTAGPQVLIRQGVKDYLEKKGTPCVYEPVEATKPEYKQKVVPYPVTEALYLLRATKMVSINYPRSALTFDPPCKECGRRNIHNSVNNEFVVDSKGEELTIFGIDIFQYGPTYVSETFLEELRAQGFTNLHEIKYRGEIHTAKKGFWPFK